MWRGFVRMWRGACASGRLHRATDVDASLPRDQIVRGRAAVGTTRVSGVRGPCPLRSVHGVRVRRLCPLCPLVKSVSASVGFVGYPYPLAVSAGRMDLLAEVRAQ